MIRPAAFAFNPQTAVNNSFQKETGKQLVQQKALAEFDGLVKELRDHGISVIVIDDKAEPHTPDAVFPNNWISFHEDGTVVVYPMFAENRRAEKNKKLLERIENRFYIRSITDLSFYEAKQEFLEGTGSMVLDRDNELAYACLSPRTHPTPLYDFANETGYRPVLFQATDEQNRDIYHTNVMMCMADEYVVICLEAVKDDFQKQMLLDKFEETGKLVIPISLEQMVHFAGNMLQVVNNTGEKFLVMSTQAFNSLTPTQSDLLQSFNRILHAPLYTIEENGGGSARCMIAEIYLPEKE